MSTQNFVSVINTSPIANLTAVTATTETALWDAALYSAIGANDENRPQRSFRLYAAGIMSFASTGTLTITPRWGTSTGGTTLGASIAKTGPGSATTNQPWRLQGDLLIRTWAGASSTAIFHGEFSTNLTTAAGTAFTLLCGGTEATIDLTASGGLFIGWTLSVAGTVTTQVVRLEELK